MKPLKVRNVNIGEGIPKIAVSITGKTKKEIKEIIDKIDKIDLSKVDIVEWRGDFFEDILDMEKALEILKIIRGSLKDTPIIFTFRTKKEGGEKEISPDRYFTLNEEIGKSGLVDIIDIEIFSTGKNLDGLIEAIKKENIFVIGSNHDFLKTPSKKEIIDRFERMEKSGVDIFKFAFMPKNPEDVLGLLKLTNKMKDIIKKPIVTISMGSLGKISRISGRIFGSSISFGALEEKSAPGQIPLDDLYNILKIM